MSNTFPIDSIQYHMKWNIDCVFSPYSRIHCKHLSCWSCFTRYIHMAFCETIVFLHRVILGSTLIAIIIVQIYTDAVSRTLSSLAWLPFHFLRLLALCVTVWSFLMTFASVFYLVLFFLTCLSFIQVWLLLILSVFDKFYLKSFI